MSLEYILGKDIASLIYKAEHSLKLEDVHKEFSEKVKWSDLGNNLTYIEVLD